MGFRIRWLEGAGHNARRRVAYLDPDVYSSGENFAALWRDGTTPEARGTLKLKPKAKNFALNLMDFWADNRPYGTKYHTWKPPQQDRKFTNKVWAFEPGETLRLLAFCVRAQLKSQAIEVLVFLCAIDKRANDWDVGLLERALGYVESTEVVRQVASLLEELED